MNFLKSKYLKKSLPNLVDVNPQNQSYSDKRLGSIELVDGRHLVFYPTQKNQKIIIEGCSVLLDGKKPGDELYKSIIKKRFEIEDGFLINEFFIQRHEQPNGDIIEVDIHRMQSANKGSRVWLHNKPAPNGQYQVGMFSYINVINGTVQ